jgi:dihydroorotate dehydrogenase (NAD+) catalytic subunit
MVGPKLAVNLGGIRLKNPVLTASGTFGYGEEYAPYLDLDRLGGIIVKGTTLKPRRGNPVPRIVETPAGMLNAIGLQNPGLDVFIREKLPYLRRLKTAVLVNISGETVAEYAEIARRLDGRPGIAGLEINISCPNVRPGHPTYAQDPRLTARIVSAVRRATRLPLLAKLSPNVTDITVPARAAEAAGADAISLINTFPGMVIDVETRRPKLASVTGGLSGPAIRPIAVLMVRKCYRAVRIPILGLGGISDARDALEFIIAGATAVAVGTANFVDPRTAAKVVAGLEQYLVRHRIPDINRLIGSLHE